jgi:hypothetical protein
MPLLKACRAGKDNDGSRHDVTPTLISGAGVWVSFADEINDGLLS